MIPVDPHRRATAPVAPGEMPLDEGMDLDYRPMPPKVSVPLAVELNVRGRGKPLPFPLDDDLSE